MMLHVEAVQFLFVIGERVHWGVLVRDNVHSFCVFVLVKKMRRTALVVLVVAAAMFNRIIRHACR